MFTFNVEMEGFKEAEKRLNRRIDLLTGRADDMYEDLQRNMVTKAILENFKAQGRPKWKAHSSEYARAMGKKYGSRYPWPVLQRFGDLLNTTITSAQWGKWHRQGRTMKLNIKSIWYGYIHQYIGVGKSKIKRKYITFTMQEIGQGMHILQLWLRGYK
jgi:phage gpG-like protein